jgi:hypothetical protein
VVHGHEPRRRRGPTHAAAVGVERRARHHPRPSPLISDGGSSSGGARSWMERRGHRGCRSRTRACQRLERGRRVQSWMDRSEGGTGGADLGWGHGGSSSKEGAGRRVAESEPRRDHGGGPTTVSGAI